MKIYNIGDIVVFKNQYYIPNARITIGRIYSSELLNYGSSIFFEDPDSRMGIGWCKEEDILRHADKFDKLRLTMGYYERT